MIRIRNNTISVDRGEVGALKFEIWNKDGTPFILPPVPDKSILNIAKKVKTFTGEVYNFFTPLQLIKLEQDNSMKPVSITINTKGEGSVNIGLLSIDGISSTNKIITQDNKVTYTIPLYTMIKSIEFIACTLESIEYIIDDRQYIIYSDNKLFSLCALTIRAANYDKIVTAKYLNLHSSIMQNGKTDYTLYGWNKFTTQDILESDTVENLLIALMEKYKSGIIQVGKVGESYYHLTIDKQLVFALKPYIFEFSIPLSYEDTCNLEPGEYTYDLIAYQGEIKGPEIYDSDEFPLKMVYWKKELIGPHKSIIGDSHNA